MGRLIVRNHPGRRGRLAHLPGWLFQGKEGRPKGRGAQAGRIYPALGKNPPAPGTAIVSSYKGSLKFHFQYEKAAGNKAVFNAFCR